MSFNKLLKYLVHRQPQCVYCPAPLTAPKPNTPVPTGACQQPLRVQFIPNPDLAARTPSHRINVLVVTSHLVQDLPRPSQVDDKDKSQLTSKSCHIFIL